jgi:hypothetical protein
MTLANLSVGKVEMSVQSSTVDYCVDVRVDQNEGLDG